MMNIWSVFSTIVNRGIVAGVLGVVCLLASVASAELPQFKIENPDEGYPTRGMGSSVSIDGDTMIIGAPYTTHNELGSAGKALVYRDDGRGGWTLEAELTASDAAPSNSFGLSVAISGDTAIVGSKHLVDGSPNSGSAYVFTRSNRLWTQVAKLTASDATALDQFGTAVAISEETAIIGAYGDDDNGDNSGSAYIFTSSDGEWMEQAKLTASDSAADDYFGFSVAISEDTVIIGAHMDDDGDRDSGSAYVFTRLDGSWIEDSKLFRRNAPSARDYFGYSVAISGDRAVVGATGAGWGGVAYVFVRQDVNWSQETVLTGQDRGEFVNFGCSVATIGDTVLVGAYGDSFYLVWAQSYSPGSAYIFTRFEGVWAQQAKVTALPPAYDDFFGNAVALSGNTVVVGSSERYRHAPGSAYVFTRSEGVWSHNEKLTNLKGAEADRFGWDVAISGNSAIVGSSLDSGDELYSGSAYVFSHLGNLWNLEGKLTVSDAEERDYFGGSVELSGDMAIVGARGDDDRDKDSGSAYVFTRSEGVWTEKAKLTASDAAREDYFGVSVAISGDTAIVGAFGDDDGGLSSGAAYVFTYSSGIWTQQAKLTASDAAEGDEFGISVALTGDTAIVGAYRDDDGRRDSGSAYIFTRSGGVWTQQARLIASDASEKAYFGGSVAVSRDTAIVGAAEDDDGGENSGSAYIFTRSGSVWTQQAKLIASDAAKKAYFGGSVAVSKDTAIVGAAGDDDGGEKSGSAYVFRRSNGVWTQHEKLTALDAASWASFGIPVATDGVHALIGASTNNDPEFFSGAAYVFSLIREAPSFTFTPEEQETPALAWNFVVPSAFDGTITGSFDAVNERLATITSTNRGAFGFWESPQLQVTDSESNATTALFIRGEAGEDALFRARWTLSSDDGMDQVNLPVVRVRAGSTNYSMTSEILATSKGNGDFSPAGDGSQYDLYYVIPAEDNLFRLSFDVINFDPTDAAVASLFIDEIILESIGRGDFGAGTSVASYDFAGDNNGFTTRNASPDLVVPETFTSSAEGLLVRGVEPSPTRGENSEIIFGFWGVETDIAFTGGKLYRVTWTVGSDAATGRELEVPTFRLRVNDSSLKFASLLHVNSYDETARVPVEGSSQEYNLWLVAPNQINGSQWTFSFDYLAVGGVPTSEDDPTIGLYLEGLRIEEYTP